KYAADNGLIDRPVLLGPGFKPPSRKTLRVHRAQQGLKLFTRDEIRRLLDAARPQLKTMIYLGINCGFGNADCEKLPLSVLDLDRGVTDSRRPKRGISRRCVLWPETIQALRDWLAKRPEPKDPAHAGLVFMTRRRVPWARAESTGVLSGEVL